MSAGTSDIYRFERNTVLRASAGTGKTETLTRLYMHLLAGATAKAEAIPVERTVALTFTEKAAHEMRQRIGQALQRNCLHGGETTPGYPQMDPELSRAALQRLDQAPITTIHAYCARLLRQHASLLDLPPGSDVLSDTQRERYLSDAVVEVLSEHLRQGHQGTRTLMQRFEQVQRGIYSIGQELARLYTELRELALPLDALPSWSQSRLQTVCAQLNCTPESFDTAATREQIYWQLQREHARLADDDSLKKPCHQALQQALSDLGELKETLSAAQLYRSAIQLRNACKKDSNAKGDGACAHARDLAQALWTLPLQLAQEDTILTLLQAIHQRFVRHKEVNDSIDFSDILHHTRALLLQHPEVRKQLNQHIEALLVDEFQDTNSLQRDIIFLLHAKADASMQSIDAAQIKPAGLFLVGDRKQSIYGFRGADVAVFESMASQLCAQGGVERSLQTNFRSIDPLLRACQHLAEQALHHDDPLPFEQRFEHARDASQAARNAEATSTTAPITYLYAASASPEDEAQAIARWLQTLRHPDTTLRIQEQDHWRPPQWHDIALLLPRMTHAGIYLDALQQLDIPATLAHPRHLWRSLESRDLITLLTLLQGQGDSCHIAAYLRSPWSGLDDSSLERLAQWQRSKPQGWHALLSASFSDLPALDNGMQQRLESALSHLQGWRNSMGYAPTWQLVDHALRVSGYRRLIDHLPNAAAAHFTLNYLVALLRQRDDQGIPEQHTLRDFQRYARGNATQNDLELPMQSQDALSIMTVHQAKGLQFPIVIAADTHRYRRKAMPRLHYENLPQHGLATQVQDPDGQWIPHDDALQELSARRQRAEARRLFYVQVTRARDHLLIVGSETGAAKQSLWQEICAPSLPWLQEQGLAQRLDVEELKTPPITNLEDASSGTTTGPPPLHPPQFNHTPSLQLSVSDALQWLNLNAAKDSHSSAQRKHRPEDMSAQEWGTLIHSALEHLDWQHAAKMPRDAIIDALPSSQPQHQTLACAQLQSLIAGSLGKRLATLAPQCLLREWPFTLFLRHPDDKRELFIRGQIDLIVADTQSYDIVDYKTSQPQEGALNPGYALQLELYTYALAQHLKHADTSLQHPIRRFVQFISPKERPPDAYPYPHTRTPFDIDDLTRTLFDAHESIALPAKAG